MPSDHVTPVRQWSGRLSDGRTAAAQDVTVSAAPDGLVIEDVAAGVTTIWRYVALATGVPLSKGATEVLVRSADAPGASLFVGDRDFVEELALRAPHLRSGATRWASSWPWIGVAVGLIGLGALVSFSGISPARIIAGYIPEKGRAAIGAQVVQALTQGRPVCQNSEGRKALDKLTERLAKASGHTETFKVMVVDWNLLNAFATAGNMIVLTRGTITKAESPDEVAGVLAHEMGHGLARHPEAAIIRAMGLTAAAQLLLTGSSSTLSNIGVMLAQLSYNRAAEREADALALDILRSAGISPKPLITFLKRAEAQSGNSSVAKVMRQNDLIATHPPTPERIEVIGRAPAYQTTPALAATDWQALRGICGSGP